jgi:hypothetical protein
VLLVVNPGPFVQLGQEPVQAVSVLVAPVLPDLSVLAAQSLLVDREGERVLYCQVLPPSAKMVKTQRVRGQAQDPALEETMVLLQLSLLLGMQQVRARLDALLLAGLLLQTELGL